MKDYSQNGESKILLNLFEKIGTKNKIFVDLGAGDGYHLSNTRMLKDLGWSGLMVDADPQGCADVICDFITKENILNILCGVCGKETPYDFDLLSIDLDGNDYHIIKKILELFNPRVIILEVNSQLPLDKSIVMPYNAAHKWDGTNAYGMSYKAAFKLLRENAYDIYDVVNNTNVIATKMMTPTGDIIYEPTWSHPEKEIVWQEV